MKREFVYVAGLLLLAVSQAGAVTVATELFLDAGGGNTATIGVDGAGSVTCFGTCGGLVFPTFLPPHTTLLVTGSLGQFTIDATGVGGISASSPILQGLNQIEAASSGAGTLFTEFTDTDYCMAGGGSCFGSNFVLSASTVTDAAISRSTATFAGFADAANAVPAGTLIGTFANLTGTSDSASGTFANPLLGSSGSLSTATSLTFTGAGQITANFQISSAGTSSVPEPATSVLSLGSLVALAAWKLRRKTHRS